MSFIEVKDVSKTFKISKRQSGVIGMFANLFVPKFERKEAVKNISFNIEQGEMVGFIGPNGAGKSTTIKITLKGTGPIKGKTVIVTFMKKQYTIKTDKNGVAQFKLTKAMVSKLGVGKTYKIRATYKMDSVAQGIQILK